MKATQAQQQALLSMLGRFYEEIRAIEEQYNIRARPEDFRPRIEYFHDTVRAFTGGEGDGFERTGRMSVESLAADAVMLRQIRDKPLIRHPELAIPLSPGSQVIKRTGQPPETTRVDISAAAKLGEGYGHYALLFISLLAYPAERNYLNRINECSQQEDMLVDVVSSLPANKDTQVDIESALASITDPELYNKLLAALKTARKQKNVAAAEVAQAAKKERESVKKTAAGIEASHMRYASSQLVLYQESQTVVKKMASQGLNVAGEFVESAMREAQRGGRGF